MTSIRNVKFIKCMFYDVFLLQFAGLPGWKQKSGNAKTRRKQWKLTNCKKMCLLLCFRGSWNQSTLTDTHQAFARFYYCPLKNDKWMLSNFVLIPIVKPGGFLSMPKVKLSCLNMPKQRDTVIYKFEFWLILSKKFLKNERKLNGNGKKNFVVWIK